MKHPIDPGEAVAVRPTMVEAQLADGEVIIRLLKPSAWFVWLEAWPIVFFAVLLAVGYHWMQGVFDLGVSEQAVSTGCVAGAFLRLMVTGLQWYGRTYVLTNLRLIRISVLFHLDMSDLPLKEIREAGTIQTWPQRMVGIGSLYFSPQKRTRHPMIWQHVSNPAELLQAVNDQRNRL